MSGESKNTKAPISNSLVERAKQCMDGIGSGIRVDGKPFTGKATEAEKKQCLGHELDREARRVETVFKPQGRGR